MNEKQKHELRLLAENLLRVPPERFTMHIWGEGNPEDANVDGRECDYAGCAIGWAPTLIPGCGLTLIRSDSYVFPYYEGEERIAAVCLYFGLSPREAVYLFDSESYEDEGDWTEDGTDIRREAVSARILEFLRGKECEPEEGSSLSGARIEEPQTAPVEARI